MTLALATTNGSWSYRAERPSSPVLSVGPLTCPSPLIKAWQMGLPLEDVWTALECAWRPEAPLQAVTLAVEQVLSPTGDSQRSVIRELKGSGIPVQSIKQALTAGVAANRFTRTIGARGAHLYRRSVQS